MHASVCVFERVYMCVFVEGGGAVQADLLLR